MKSSIPAARHLVLSSGRELAVKAMQPKVPPMVAIGHIHMVRVSVREHAAILHEKLTRLRTATFRALCADCQSTLEVVARFLALLELFRDGAVGFDQVSPLGELTIRWTGSDDGEVTVSDEFDEEEAAAQAADPDGEPSPGPTG